MEIVEVGINNISPYEKNPRNNDDAVEATANSIKEFGWQQPIVVDKDGVIIVGHTRLKAAKRLGLTKVPVIYASNLSEEKVNAYRLADNKTGELADWDVDMLNGELNDIINIDMEDFGFDELDESDFQQKDENTDPVPIDDKTVIIIESDDDAKLKKYFDKLVEEGYPCRLSTL